MPRPSGRCARRRAEDATGVARQLGRRCGWGKLRPPSHRPWDVSALRAPGVLAAAAWPCSERACPRAAGALVQPIGEALASRVGAGPGQFLRGCASRARRLRTRGHPPAYQPSPGSAPVDGPVCERSCVRLNMSARGPALGVPECALVAVSVSLPTASTAVPVCALAPELTGFSSVCPACGHSVPLTAPWPARPLTSWKSPESGLRLRGPSAPHIQLSPSWPVFAHFGEEVEEVGGSGLWTPFAWLALSPWVPLISGSSAVQACCADTEHPQAVKGRLCLHLSLFLIFIYLKTLQKWEKFYKKSCIGKWA